MKTFMDTSFFAQFNLEIYRNPVRPTMSDTAAGPEIKPTYIQHRPFNLVATRVLKRNTFLGNSICQGCRRFETSVFFSVKINISTTGGSRVGFFQPDTNHP